MPRFSTFTTMVLLILCASHFAFAQADTSLIMGIQHYTRYIDSVSRLANAQALGFSRSIAEGSIRSAGPDGEQHGGFGIYTLSRPRCDTVFRIEYHDNLYVNIYKIYYFKDNKLVYATLELKEYTTNGKRIYQKEEFYDNGKVIRTTTTANKNAEKYLYRTDISLPEDGIQLLAEFREKNKRH